MGFGVDPTGSDNGVSGIGGNEPDYDNHQDSDDHSDRSRSDAAKFQKEVSGKDTGDGQSQDDSSGSDNEFSRSDFDNEVRKSTGKDVYGGELPSSSDDDRAASNKTRVVMVPDPLNPGEYITIQPDRLRPMGMWNNPLEVEKTIYKAIGIGALGFSLAFGSGLGTPVCIASGVASGAGSIYVDYQSARGTDTYELDFGIGHTSGNFRF